MPETQPVHIERLTIRPSFACNFRCKLCNEFAPYYTTPKIPSLDEMTRDVDRIFSLVDTIGKLEISGGEPLLFRPLPELLRYLNRYNDRFGLFSLVTNGSLPFTDTTLAALRAIGSKTRVIVDDYGLELSRNAQKCAKQLNDNGIRYELRDQYQNVHSDGWLDFRDLALKHNEEQAKAIFAQCVCPQKLHWVVTLHDGKLYPCHVARRCTELGLVSETAPDCIKLYDENRSDNELRADITSLYTIDILQACRFCEGFLETRQRLMPAEQLPIGGST